MLSIQFFLTSLVVVLIPGTGVMYTVSTALVRKAKYGVLAAAGCTLGIIPHMAACILGLSALMNMGAHVFTVIRLCGAAYLFYLAVKTWMYAGKTEAGRGNCNSGAGGVIIKGIVLNLLNPKLTLFFLSFLPQFIPSGTGKPVVSMLLLSFMFMLMTLAGFIFYALTASCISSLVLKSRRTVMLIERSFAVVFAGLAVKLAVSRGDA
jgi:threonine/homoserine/homoserine lactone efflux protein